MFELFRFFQPATQVFENPPCKFNTPSSIYRPETLKKSRLYDTGMVFWCVPHTEQLYSQAWVKVIFFSKDGYFSVFFQSAAACSQGLVASVWWCNAVTVLLQSSRKASATAFRPTLASDKDTYTAQQRSGHRSLSGLTERRRAEAKGGERKCHVLVMKYRTVLKTGSGFSPKLILVHAKQG